MSRPPLPNPTGDRIVHPPHGRTGESRIAPFDGRGGAAGPPDRAAAALAALAASTLAGCVVVPSTTTTYDAACAIESRRVMLEPVQIGYVVGCHGRECGALLVAAGATALASAVISGSIAVVGNVVYWLEEQGQCRGALPRGVTAP